MMSFNDLLTIPLHELASQKLRPVKVAVLDTGIDASHEALKGKVLRAFGYRRNAVGEMESVRLSRTANNDPSGHGTGAAGIIGTLAPNVRFIDYRVLDADNGGYGSTVLKGLEEAIESDVDIINMSVAYRKDRYWEQTAKLLEKAYLNNKIVVASKRNIPLPDDLGLPAELSNAISVDIGDYTNPFVFRYLRKSAIEFSAHGESVLTARTGGGYTRMTGTSFATPVVAALCALLRGRNSNLRLFEIKTLLKHNAEKCCGYKFLQSNINPLEMAPLHSNSQYQNIEYRCKSCGQRTIISDAFSSVKCTNCGFIGARTILLDPRLYFNIIEEIKATVHKKYCFHDWRHARSTVESAYKILSHCPKLTIRQKKCLLFAALTHDIGFMNSDNEHEVESSRIAGEIAAGCGYSGKEILLIQSLIMSTAIGHKPKNLCEKIIHDADLSHVRTKWRKKYSILLRRELANCGQKFSDVEWQRREHEFLSNVHFYFPLAEDGNLKCQKS